MNGKWYFLSNGQVQSQVTDLVFYDDVWFYISEGVLNTAINGLIEYNGGTFLVAAGKLREDVTGLWFNSSEVGGDDTFVYLVNGQVVDYMNTPAVVFYDGCAFLVDTNGKLSTYTGTYTYDGAVFNVVNGQFYDQVA